MKGRNLVIAAVAVVFVVVVLGFVANVPVTQAITSPTTTVIPSTQVQQVVVVSVETNYVTGTYVSSSTIVYQTSSQSYATIAEQTTTNQGVFTIPSTTLDPNYYTYASASLPALASVTISWITDNSVDVYVFTSAEYSAYSGSGSTSATGAQSYVAQDTGTGSGSLSFVTSAADRYYLVLHNPNTGFLGINVKNDQVSSSGTATYNVQTSTEVAQTNTYLITSTLYNTITTTTSSTTSIPQTVSTTVTDYSTSTGVTTSTTSCSFPFWEWLAGNNRCVT